MMDYLQIVNEVLKRMREDTVSSLYENMQSTVVSSLVNDAKRIVEDAHDWSAYETDIAITTNSGNNSYSLTNSQNRATIVDVRDLTNKAIMERTTSAYIRKQEMVNNPGESRPSRWALEGVDSNGDDVFKVWPTPDGAYMLSIHATVRQGDLTAEGDVIIIPTQPIIHYAHALAAQERGDVGGADAQQLNGMAKKSLGDAIMYDAGKNPDRQVWYPV